jgi:hypothetical protein
MHVCLWKDWMGEDFFSPPITRSKRDRKFLLLNLTGEC